MRPALGYHDPDWPVQVSSPTGDDGRLATIGQAGAAEHAFGLGRADLVDQLVSAAARTDLSKLDWARMQWLREIFNDGVPGDATRVFELSSIARDRHRRRADQGRAAAAAVRAALHVPVFRNPANIRHAVSLTAEQFHYSFGNALPVEESDELWERWSIPAPGRPLFEAAEANFSLHSPAKVNTRNEDRGPLLLVMGGQDHTVPEAITKSTLKQYRHSGAVTELTEFRDRGHSLTIDGGWRAVAGECLGWLAKQGL